MATLNVSVNGGSEDLPEAKVVIERNDNRYIKRTDDDGVATFTNISNGEYDIEITKPYYTIHTGSVSVTGTTSRQYTLSEVSGTTVNKVTPSDGRVVFDNMSPGNYYVMLEDDTWENVVSYESLDESGRAPIYYLREIRSNFTISVFTSEGSPLDGAIVQLGDRVIPTDTSGNVSITIDNGTYPLVVSHPDFGIHSKTLTIDDHGSHTLSLPDVDPDVDAPPNDATFIAHASINSGESITATIEEDIGITGTYDNSEEVQLSNGYNEIALQLDGGNNRYRWTADFTSTEVERSPDLFAGNVHIGIASSIGTVQLQGVNVPVYEPNTISTPQLQFDTSQGVLAARLRSPASDDVLQVELNGNVYGVEI